MRLHNSAAPWSAPDAFPDPDGWSAHQATINWASARQLRPAQHGLFHHRKIV